MGGRLHFYVMQKKYDTPRPSNPAGKNLDPPPDIWQNVCDPHPNSQYSSPQTQTFIFAINIKIATTYMKIVCLLWIAMFLRIISWAWRQSEIKFPF